MSKVEHNDKEETLMLRCVNLADAINLRRDERTICDLIAVSKQAVAILSDTVQTSLCLSLNQKQTKGSDRRRWREQDGHGLVFK